MKDIQISCLFPGRRKKGKRQNTVRGRDVVIPVPVGTTVTTEDGQILGELEEVGSRVLVAQGGRGGSPGTEGWCGETGQRGIIRLDLRLVADVALVGYAVEKRMCFVFT